MNIEKLVITTDYYDIELDGQTIIVKDVQSGEFVYEQDGPCVAVVSDKVDNALDLIEMVKNIKETIK